jgi:transposase
VGPRALAGPSSKALSERRTIVWVDESGFYLLPAVGRTYAPRGETPVLRAPLSRDHWSVIGGLTASGRLLLQMQAPAFRGPTIVRFLQHLLRQIPGKLLVIWDGAPIHRAEVVKDFLAQGAAARLQLEALPGYAPELNPAEGVWHYLKQVELRNVCCDDLAELRGELRLAVQRLRRKRRVLQGCVAQCGYAPLTVPVEAHGCLPHRGTDGTEAPRAA